MTDWETEVRFRRFLRDNSGITPYQDAAKWRRRFWIALLVDLILSIVVLVMVTTWR